MLDFMDWVLIAGFILLAVAVSTEIALRKWRNNDGGDDDGDTHTRGMQEVFAAMYGGGGTRLKIPADCPKTDFDFIVDLECPDGSIARVLIPIDPHTWEGRGSRTLDNDARPVGLNLAYPGHYT